MVLVSSVVAIQAFLAEKLHLSSDGKIWREWLKIKNRDWRDVATLLTSDVRIEFEMRAIAVLLVPHFKFLPAGCMWKEEGSSINMLGRTDKPGQRPFNVANLPVSLQMFTRELLCLCVKAARDHRDQGDIYSSLEYYNQYVIDLLKIVPEELFWAQDVFECYELRDPLVYSNQDECSGYNPLLRLFREDIPEKWKDLASDKMHEIILSEVEGTSRPRTRHEDALQWYVECIRSPLILEDSVPYSEQLLASQMQFVLAMSRKMGVNLLRNQDLCKMVNALWPHYRDIGHSLARYVVLESPVQDFYISDRFMLKTAEKMCNGFADDIELASRLEHCIKKAKDRFEQEEKTLLPLKAKEARILEQMR